jgi:hypothetical protein
VADRARVLFTRGKPQAYLTVARASELLHQRQEPCATTLISARRLQRLPMHWLHPSRVWLAPTTDQHHAAFPGPQHPYQVHRYRRHWSPAPPACCAPCSCCSCEPATPTRSRWSHVAPSLEAARWWLSGVARGESRHAAQPSRSPSPRRLRPPIAQGSAATAVRVCRRRRSVNRAWL